MSTDDKRAENQAKSQYESIEEMVSRLHGEGVEYDNALEAIQEDPLSVLVRSDWHTPSADDAAAPYEYEILLCTGGPAVRILGTLDEHNIPDRAQLEYQDWFTPWEKYTDAMEDTLLEYARCFSYDL